MRSDVTLATALSGGVDSTAVYSMVHHLMNSQSDATRVPDDWQQAFVQTFPGTEIDERAWAEKAVSHTNGSATYLVPDNKSLADDVLKTNVHFDAISTTPIIALMGVYKGMRDNGVTVSLDGHGVDEMLFGYKKLVHEAHQYHTWNASENEAKKIAEVLASLFPEEQRERKLKGYCKEIDLAQAKRNSLMGKIKKVYRNLSPRSEAILVSDLLPTRSAETYEFGEYNALDQAVLTDFFQGSLPSLLRNFDKAAMYSSIEIRMPFMDYRLVEKSFSLPVSSKLGGGYTKRILRDAMAGIMPEANRVRTYKVGLGAPTGRWMHKELKELVTDTLNSKSFKESNLFEGGETLDLFNDIETASDPRNIEVWKHLNAHWISS
jgi:asparagine synthase (glutamine-hydrolysing)